MSVKVDTINFNSLPNCLSMSNGEVELVITTDFGPRILFLGLSGQKKNIFKIFPEQLQNPVKEAWMSFGGHRLWHAPEVFPRTYYPDNEKVTWNWDGATLVLTPPAEKTNGIVKTLEIRMADTGTTVTINHRLSNCGVWPIEISAWCLSVMAPGGKAIVPQEEFRSHPECLTPARPLVLWHFTTMNDPRFTWGEKYIQLREDSTSKTKQKFGIRNSKGWAAYVLGDLVFLKKSPCVENTDYPDMGSSQEFYTEAGFLEMESLSPLSKLEPGKEISHIEKWALFTMGGLENEKDFARLDALAEKYL